MSFHAARTRAPNPIRLAVSLSLLAHLALVAAVLLGFQGEPRRQRESEKTIDIVSVEEFLPPPLAAAAPARPESPVVPQPRPQPAEALPPRPQSDIPFVAEESEAPVSASAMVVPVSPAPPPAPVSVAAGASGSGSGDEAEFLPQFKVTEVPVIPAREVLSRIQYPPLAARQGIEASVYLELLIDSGGRIQKIRVLKDPGFGFAEAAVSALAGLVCSPAKAGGQAVAVRFRYPVRFSLK
jgi:protein TonB